MTEANATVDTTVSRTKGGRREVSLGEATRVRARIAALSFGGPAGRIAVMRRILVEEKRWIGETRFLHALHALNDCMLQPGREALQLAVHVGGAPLAVFRFKIGMIPVLAACSATGLLLHLATVGAG